MRISFFISVSFLIIVQILNQPGSLTLYSFTDIFYHELYVSYLCTIFVVSITNWKAAIFYFLFILFKFRGLKSTLLMYPHLSLRLCNSKSRLVKAHYSHFSHPKKHWNCYSSKIHGSYLPSGYI